MFVPVLDKNNKPLMPTSPKRARELLKKGKAIKRWFKGVFAIKLTEREGGEVQDICLGIDPGSKKEGFTVKSESHTYLNIQADAVTTVKDKIESRRNARRARRARNTPYRKCRLNRKRKDGYIPPSTKARWQFKLSIINWLRKIYPISHIIVEDIAAITKKGKRRWNTSFSPLEVGKNWFYQEIKNLKLKLTKIKGYETKKLRDDHNLSKNKEKMKSCFYSHCVDSWVMANSVVGGHVKPDNVEFIEIKPLDYHRRQLHVFQPSKDNIRKNYGGTRSLGFKRGSLVVHKKHGLVIVGGNSKGKISLHDRQTNQRVCQNSKLEECKFLTYLRFRKEKSSSSIS
jgi:hypothetical protein